MDLTEGNVEREMSPNISLQEQLMRERRRLGIARRNKNGCWEGCLGTAGLGLFAGPNQSAIMSFAPRQVMGTVSGLSGLGRNLGEAQGPALATIVWTVSGSGLSEIRAGLVLMVAVTGLGALSATLVRSTPHRISAGAPEAVQVASQEVHVQGMLVK